MKRIILKTTEINLKPFTGEEKIMPFSYKDIIMNSMRQSMPEGGFSFIDIETRLKIVQKLEEVSDNTFIILEDKQYTYLLEVLKKEKWMFMDQVIIDFIKSIEQAEDK
jgi:hypothetical protein